MFKHKLFHSFVLIVLTTALIFSCLPLVLGHGGGPKIIPAALSVSGGSFLKVSVTGLKSAKTATFKLTGTSGQYKLGTFPITSDDFEQVLQIPAKLSPGSYRLSVEGGGRSASVVISVTAPAQPTGPTKKAEPKQVPGERIPKELKQKSESAIEIEPKRPAGTPIDLKVIRPDWLKGLVALLILVSLAGGFWLLRSS